MFYRSARGASVVTDCLGKYIDRALRSVSLFSGKSLVEGLNPRRVRAVKQRPYVEDTPIPPPAPPFSAGSPYGARNRASLTNASSGFSVGPDPAKDFVCQHLLSRRGNRVTEYPRATKYSRPAERLPVRMPRSTHKDRDHLCPGERGARPRPSFPRFSIKPEISN